MVTKIAGNDNFDTSSTLGNTGWGQVATMGMLGDADGTTTLNIGATIAGSSLDRAYSVTPFGYATITALSGTWRVMGYNAITYYGTICIRIS